jgi:hypothetical protein
MFSTREEFFEAIRSQTTEDLLSDWILGGRLPHAFSSEVELAKFFEVIRADWMETEYLAVAGTSGWRYSLNPQKDFSEYSQNSDIDVINISESHFHQTWDCLRNYHRKVWYAVDHYQRQKLLRNGQNIYSGFASPKWIPNKGDEFRFVFESRLETYSIKAIGYRTVNMMFFRNTQEATDYYRRGIEIAKSRV